MEFAIRLPFADSWNRLTDVLEDAFEESGTSALDIAETKRHPRKFLVQIPGSNDLEVWVYAWYLVQDWETAEKSFRLLLPAKMPMYRSCARANIVGQTIILGYEPTRKIFAGLGSGGDRGDFSPTLGRLRVPLDLLDKGSREGMAFSEWINQWKFQEAMVVFRPDLLLDYVQALEDIHYMIKSDEAREYMQAWSLASAPPANMLAMVSTEEKEVIEKTKKRIRDKDFRKRILAAYDNRCAVTGVKLRLVDAAHIYPAKFLDSSEAVGNGILLSPTLHRAFDRGLIFLDEEYVMRINEKKVSRLVRDRLDDGIEEFCSLLEKQIHLPEPSQRPDKSYIERALVVRKIKKKKD